jgi:ribosomal protein L16 Arg81 hydroxylase
MVDVIHVQLVGEKRWYVLSPAAQLHLNNDGDPDFKRLLRDPATKLMQCVLRPGETLYLPALWWHRVELLSDSIGLSRKCLDPRHLQTHIRLRMAELLAVALNAEEVRRTHPELFPVVVRRARTWARRMNIDLSQLRPDLTSGPIE